MININDFLKNAIAMQAQNLYDREKEELERTGSVRYDYEFNGQEYVIVLNMNDDGSIEQEVQLFITKEFITKEFKP